MKNYGKHVAPARRQPPTNFSDLSVLILGAAPSKKMKPLGARSLIPISHNTLTLIQHQNDTIKNVFPGAEIILVCGVDWVKIREKCPRDVRLILNPNYDSTNVIYSAVLGLLSILNSKVLVIYGDLLFDMEFIRNGDLTKSAVYLTEYCQYDVGLIHNNGKVDNFGFGLPNKWAQMTFLTGRELSIANQLAKSDNIEKILGFEFLNEIMAKGGEFSVIDNKQGKLLEIDNYKEVNQANEWK